MKFFYKTADENALTSSSNLPYLNSQSLISRKKAEALGPTKKNKKIKKNNKQTNKPKAYSVLIGSLHVSNYLLVVSGSYPRKKGSSCFNTNFVK